MLDASIFSCVEIPLVIFLIQPHFIHLHFKNIKSFFSLTAADDFTYPW
jgi:hypothetical protein